MYRLEDALECVGPGWAGLIRKLYEAKPEDVTVTDVKEKFGALRFNVGYAPYWYLELVDCTEAQSKEVCEMCGGVGSLRKRGWWKTLCDRCEGGI